MFNTMRLPDDAQPVLSIGAILENPLFAVALRDVAVKLITMHDESPRIVRYNADMQKWLLTQAILALHFEHLTDRTRPGLTAANLIAFMVDNRVASKNTAVACLAEMRNYRILLDVENAADKRFRPLRLSDTAEGLIREWFDGHLKSLDMLDHGTRYERSAADPRLLWYAQPRMCQRLFYDEAWSSPPETVYTLVRTGSGSNILHDLIARLPPRHEPEPRNWIGPLKVGDLARRYIISRSHIHRVFTRARALGIVGWELKGNSGNFWISDSLILDQRRWQATKFAAIEEAFQWACRHLPGEVATEQVA